MRTLMDSSALFKRYSREPGREQVLAAGERASELVVAAHCKLEIAAAFQRQRHEGLLSAQEYERIMAIVQGDFADFTVVPLDSRVEAHALSAMAAVRLPVVDALHIGSAQLAKVDLFVTADPRQAQAAQALGLKTLSIEA